jgi:hypothetical protein
MLSLYAPLSSMMRNHKEARYLITPANTLWGLLKVLLIFSKNMTTDSLLVRYIFKVVIGEYWDGTKEVERGGEEAVASWADAAKGQGLRRGCAGGGRGAPNCIHMEGVA